MDTPEYYYNQIYKIAEEAFASGHHSSFLVALGVTLVTYEDCLVETSPKETKGAIGLALVCATLKHLKSQSTDNLPFDEFITVPTKK